MRRERTQGRPAFKEAKMSSHSRASITIANSLFVSLVTLGIALPSAL